MTVKELSSKHETSLYFDGEAHRLGRSQSLKIGDSAFRTPDGSLVVRKDYKVLTIDVSGLPDLFGKPPTARERGREHRNRGHAVLDRRVGMSAVHVVRDPT